MSYEIKFQNQQENTSYFAKVVLVHFYFNEYDVRLYDGTRLLDTKEYLKNE